MDSGYPVAMLSIRAGIVPVLFAVSLLGQVTQVNLSPSASPNSADPVVTTVTVIGHNFPKGTIPPANVTVTLNPATPGAGPSGETTATKVTVVSGTTERVSFQVPKSIAVAAATAYAVSIAGTTQTGAKFQSSNTAALTVNAPVAITTSALATGTVGIGYSQTLAASGGTGQYTWQITSGSLPGGLSLNGGTGLISGKPTSAGTLHCVLKVTDGDQTSTSKNFAITIDPALSITTDSPLPTGTVGVNYAQTLAATGGSGRYTWSISAGKLPPGLTLNATTGAITGQPSAAGTQNFTIQVTDSNQASATKPFSLTINPALSITTSSPLPAGTVGMNYAQTLAATGGSGQYGWSVSAGALPGGILLNAATGALSGSPTTAGTPGFTIQVTDTNNVAATKPFTVTIDPPITITTTSPLPAGEVGVNYSAAFAATGGDGQYTWSVTAGVLPNGISLTASTGALSGQPTATGASNFTIQAKDTNQATATQPFSLTINPAATLLSVSPKSANAGVSLKVTITGSNTHFVQGTTEVSFGSGVSVTGVTVASATSASAQITISSSAAVGPATVTATTGSEQASLVNGFSISAAVPIINVNTATATPLAPGFSGFDDEYLINGVEYWDPKYLAMVEPLKPGWIRFPAGTPSMAFDWQTSHENLAWMSSLAPLLGTYFTQILEKAQQLTQAKTGASFANYATFLDTVGANGIVAFNGYTDNTTESAYKMLQAAQQDGANIIEWELDNEPYVYSTIYATPADYAAAMYSPYYTNIVAANPAATAGVFYQGEFNWQSGDYITWDSGMSTYSPQYWNGVSFHVYPIGGQTLSTTDEEQTLNGILAHGTNEYFSSYIEPLIGPNMPVFITELNSGTSSSSFEAYLYNAVFLAEYVARMSIIPQVKAVGIAELYLGNNYSQGMIRAVNDFEPYLLAQIQKNPNYSTDTSTNPDTQFSFYYSTNALAMEIANLAINASTGTWATSVYGSPTVPILGYDGNPVPAVYAQGYQGAGGAHYLLVTNKSGAPVPVAIEAEGNLLETTLQVSYISNVSDIAQNTATQQTNVQIVNTTSPNPVTVGPYSVTRIQW